MSRNLLTKLGLIAVGIPVLAILVYQIPSINSRVDWQVDIALTYLRGIIDPVKAMPTALPQPAVAVTLNPTKTPSYVANQTTPLPVTPLATPTVTLTPTQIPDSIVLTPPIWEKQTPNNCGPATLSLYLQTYGWGGTQADIASKVKIYEADRNVNVDELVYYVRNNVGWLNAEFRVGGNIELIKKMIAAGIPVMIEEGFYLDETYWPNDDRWAGHYLLITGYDDATQTFITQDSFRGANQAISYDKVKEQWQAFNYVYIMLYRPEQEAVIKSILRDDFDPDVNRQNALELSQDETKSPSATAYAWFNLGSNLVYFEDYGEAGRAYDTARELSLPQRMLRYQFGPFFAYFFSGRNEDLLTLTKYALQRTPNSEEALLWQGWGLYRDGKKAEALENFRIALEKNPFYQDAQYAINFIQENP